MTKKISLCREPWWHMYIHSNGQIKPCCYAAGSLGNINNGDTIGEIVKGDLLKELKDYISNDKLHGICAGSGCVFVQGSTPMKANLDSLTVEVREHISGLDVDDRTINQASFEQPVAMFLIGKTLEDAGRFLKAEIWYQRAADLGHTKSAHSLACSLVYSEVDRFDEIETLARAADYFEKAVSMGYSHSFIDLGVMYEKGLHFDVDIKKSCELYRDGAKAGDPRGWRKLAALVEQGVLDYGADTKKSEIQRLSGLAERLEKRIMVERSI